MNILKKLDQFYKKGLERGEHSRVTRDALCFIPPHLQSAR